MAEANGWKIWLEVHHTGWVPNWYSAGLICPLTALPDTPEIKLNTQMKASFHMNCHRVISKDVNSQISIFLFLHTKENYWNKLEGNILFDATDKRIGTSFSTNQWKRETTFHFETQRSSGCKYSYIFLTVYHFFFQLDLQANSRLLADPSIYYCVVLPLHTLI